MIKKSTDGNRPPVNNTTKANQRPVRDREMAVDPAGTALTCPAMSGSAVAVRRAFDKKPRVSRASWPCRKQREFAKRRAAGGLDDVGVVDLGVAG